MEKNKNTSEIIIFKTNDEKVAVNVVLEDETVWLTQEQMAQIFGVQLPAITKHLKNIFSDGELNENMVSSILEHTTTHGAIKGKTQLQKVKIYNLDAIIAVGYRVNSKRATQFRKWATQRLKEYIIKGFAIDDDRLKGVAGGNYWKELLDRIRDIRSSEKVLYRQVLDLYATSTDYDPKSKESKLFFATVQNKLSFTFCEY